jgi:hypothetical protein
MSPPSRRPTLALIAALTLAVSLVGGAPAASASSVEAVFVTKANAARAAAGLPPLSVRSDLASAARRHSGAMSAKGALFHSGLAGICCFRSLSENVGAGASAGAVHMAFLGSSRHRANILDPATRHIGVGVVRSGGTLWVTEIFRAPRGGSGSSTDATGPTAQPTGRAGTGARGSRGTVRRPPSFDDVLRLRIDQLADRRLNRSHDPLVSALRWSSTMKTLTAAPQ